MTTAKEKSKVFRDGNILVFTTDELNRHIEEKLNERLECLRRQVNRLTLPTVTYYSRHAGQPYAQHILREYMDEEGNKHTSQLRPLTDDIQDFLTWLEKKFKITIREREG